MLWFKKRRDQEQRICDKEAITSVAVKTHKQKEEKVIKSVTRSTAQFNRSLKNNHIMFKMHSATTGRGH